MPQMLPVHFAMLKRILENEGFKIDMLNTITAHRGGRLKYVHNDTCYPAFCVIGQLIDAVKRGGYDPHKVGLLITQTGGGCRASNYIHLLRKALEKAGRALFRWCRSICPGWKKTPASSCRYPFCAKRFLPWCMAT